jgi:hypothetical protein
MPRKHARPDAQVERLAAQLRDRWTAADGIVPWLRRRLPLLTRLNQDEGWSWADIGRALDAAGITYESGRPWTGFLLARKVGQARAQVRARKAKRMDEATAPLARRAVRAASSPVRERKARAPLPDGSEEAPGFAPASLAPSTFVPPKSPGESGGTKSPSPAQKRVDVDAVIRRLQGGDAGSDNEG